MNTVNVITMLNNMISTDNQNTVFILDGQVER